MRFTYLPHGKPMPENYELIDDLQGTHHGHFAVLVGEKEEKSLFSILRRLFNV